jgi:Cu2+-exporting ATPase/Cu+-exporting ATPase
MATFVLLYGGKAIYRRALKGVFSAGFGMETLITMGVFTAYLYSTYQFFSGSIHLYYDTACMLIVLVLLGKFLESGLKPGYRKISIISSLSGHPRSGSLSPGAKGGDM